MVAGVRKWPLCSRGSLSATGTGSCWPRCWEPAGASLLSSFPLIIPWIAQPITFLLDRVYLSLFLLIKVSFWQILEDLQTCWWQLARISFPYNPIFDFWEESNRFPQFLNREFLKFSQFLNRPLRPLRWQDKRHKKLGKFSFQLPNSHFSQILQFFNSMLKYALANDIRYGEGFKIPAISFVFKWKFCINFNFNSLRVILCNPITQDRTIRASW